MTKERPLILGSCVSRDIFNFYEAQTFELVDYYSRASLISLMSRPPVSSEVLLDRVASTFQRRMVERDLTQDFLRRVSGMDFDYLLLDFIDERYDVLEIESGRYVTISQEFSQTNFLISNPWLNDRVISSGSVKFKVLWHEALLAFLRLAEDFDFKSRILLNRVSWAKTLEDGQTIPGTSGIYTDRNNGLLEWMYALVERELEAKQILRFPRELFVSKGDHRWGPAPFHYADQYYNHAKYLLHTRASYQR